MKLAIMIPAFNEAAVLSKTIAEIPKKFDGIEQSFILVINDGSTDETEEVALRAGADRVINHPYNMGLSAALQSGIKESLNIGADLIVNTDADNQYKGKCINDLIKPCLKNGVDLVVGCRPIRNHPEFSSVKIVLQLFGSWVVRKVSGSNVIDAPSGFRCFSKKFARHLKIYNKYTYTIESIFQASFSGFKIENVPVEINLETRPSKLVKNIPNYVFRSISAIISSLLIYRPTYVFNFVAFVNAVLGMGIGLRFLINYLNGTGDGHIQSLLLCVLLLIISVISLLAGILAKLIAVNRTLLEEIRVLKRY